MPSSAKSRASSREWCRHGVVGHHPLDARAVVGEEGRRVAQEAHRGRRSLIGVDADEGQAGRIVDGNVEVVVAHATVAAAGARPQHAVTAAVGHPAQLLDVDVDQLVGPLTDVAQRRAGQAIGMRQAADTVAAQDAIHGRARVAQQRPQTVRPDPQPTAQAQDAAHAALVQGARRASWSRRAILEAGQPLGSIAAQPLVGGGATHAERLGGDRRRPALDQDPINQQPPAKGRQPGGTMEHESPPSVWSFDNPKPSRGLSICQQR